MEMEMAHGTIHEPSASLRMPSLSLELLAKKKNILESELEKLQACLRERSGLLCRLRQASEAMLIHNAKMENRVNSHGEKLQALQTATALDTDQLNGVEGIEACEEKLSLCRELVHESQRQQSVLENKAMVMEEASQRSVKSIQKIEEQYSQISERRKMLEDDIQIHVSVVEAEIEITSNAEDGLSRVACQNECNRLRVHSTEECLREIAIVLKDRCEAAKNIHEMVSEDLVELKRDRLQAEAQVQDIHEKLRRSTAVFPQDYELEEKAASLKDKLEKISVGIADAKTAKHDAVGRRKEERELLRVLISTVKSREDQVQWLERQLTHLKASCETKESLLRANERAFEMYRRGYQEQMEQCRTCVDGTLQEAKTMKTRITELQNRAIEAQNTLRDKRTEVDTQEHIHIEQTQELQQALEEATLLKSEIASIRKETDAVRKKSNDQLLFNDRVRMSCEDELALLMQASHRQSKNNISTQEIKETCAQAARSAKNMGRDIFSKYAVDATQLNATTQIRHVFKCQLNREREDLQQAIDDAMRTHELAKAAYVKRKTDDLDRYEKAISEMQREYESACEPEVPKETTASSKTDVMPRTEGCEGMQEDKPVAHEASNGVTSKEPKLTVKAKSRNKRAGGRGPKSVTVQDPPVPAQSLSPPTSSYQMPAPSRANLRRENETRSNSCKVSKAQSKTQHSQEEQAPFQPVFPAVVKAKKVKKVAIKTIKKTSTRSSNWLEGGGFSFS